MTVTCNNRHDGVKIEISVGERNNLPSLPHRKIGSVDGQKRMQEIYAGKGMYAKSPAYIGKAKYEDGARPLMPLMMRDERKQPSAMRQAGLAVVERPQHYVIPIRPMKDRIVL